jgi:hypothetical protein
MKYQRCLGTQIGDGGKVPRTYIVLRTIGPLKLVNELIDAGFSDYWFSVTDRSLPGCSLPTLRASFGKTQSSVLIKKNYRPGEKRKCQHCYYKEGESPPCKTERVFGKGALGQIDRVFSLISFKEYARKPVP